MKWAAAGTAIVGACIAAWWFLDSWLILLKLAWLKFLAVWMWAKGKVLVAVLLSRASRLVFRDVPGRLLNLLVWAGIGPKMRRTVRRWRTMVRVLMRRHRYVLAVAVAVGLLALMIVSWIWFGVIAAVFTCPRRGGISGIDTAGSSCSSTSLARGAGSTAGCFVGHCAKGAGWRTGRQC